VAANHERMNAIFCQNCAVTTHINLKAADQIVGLRFGDVVVISDDDGEDLL
jgi:hypothetical protein